MAGIVIHGEPLQTSVMTVILTNMCHFEEITLTKLSGILENSIIFIPANTPNA